MSGSYAPEITEIKDGASANRLILRINPLVGGVAIPQPQGRSLGQVSIEGIIGSPEGRSIGSPGDLRVRRDLPQVWQKISGERTRTGWQLLGTGGGGGGGTIPIEQNGVPVGEASELNFTGSTAVSVDGDGVASISSGLDPQWFGFNLSGTGPFYLNLACGVAVSASATGNVGTSMQMGYTGRLLRVVMRSYIANYGSTLLESQVDGVVPVDSDTQDLNTGGDVTFDLSNTTFNLGQILRLRITTTLVGAGVSACLFLQPE